MTSGSSIWSCWITKWIRSFSIRKYGQAPGHRQYRNERYTQTNILHKSRPDESIKGLCQCQYCKIGVCKNLLLGKRKVDPYAP